MWEVLDLRPVSWNLNKIEGKAKMKLSKDARIKTPNGTMPSNWEDVESIYIKKGEEKYRKISIPQCGNLEQRKEQLKLYLKLRKKKLLFAKMPALEKQVKRGN